MKDAWYAEWVDLKRYPIEDLKSPAAQKLLESCRKDLARLGAVEMRGFVNPAGVARMVQESVQIESMAHHNALVGNAYLDEPDPNLPPDHVRKMMEPTALGAIGYDQIPSSHLLRQLYEWDGLLAFIAAILGLEKIYHYADPMGALNVSVMKDQDYLRWHFDQTDFVTSLSIRNSDKGGKFEYVPLIRSEQDQNYDAVRAILKGGNQGVTVITNEPGTLVLFKGRYSIHRVTTIEGKTSRLMGLLGFDSKPGVNSSEYLRKIRYGRTKPVESK